VLSLAVLLATWLQFNTQPLSAPLSKFIRFSLGGRIPGIESRLINTLHQVLISHSVGFREESPVRTGFIRSCASNQCHRLILFPRTYNGFRRDDGRHAPMDHEFAARHTKVCPHLCSDVCNVDVDRLKRCRRLRIPPVMSSFMDRCRRYAMPTRRQRLMGRGRGRRRLW
jgi:hypothetical protein